jgi:zinc protease
LSTGGSVDDIKSWPDRIKAVTANAVQEAARSWLQKRRSVTGYLVKEAAPDNEKAEQPQKKEKRT